MLARHNIHLIEASNARQHVRDYVWGDLCGRVRMPAMDAVWNNLWNEKLRSHEKRQG